MTQPNWPAYLGDNEVRRWHPDGYLEIYCTQTNQADCRCSDLDCPVRKTREEHPTLWRGKSGVSQQELSQLFVAYAQHLGLDLQQLQTILPQTPATATLQEILTNEQD